MGADMSSKQPSTAPIYELGLFDATGAAHAAVRDLVAKGFSPKKISVFVQAREEGKADPELDQAIDAGGDAGAGLGAVAGGAGGLLLSLGLLTIPGVGPVLGVGPLAATLTGAITGGAFGGFSGALTGLGISEAHSLAAERHVKSGRMIVAIDCGDRAADARSILLAHGAIVEP